MSAGLKPGGDVGLDAADAEFCLLRDARLSQTDLYVYLALVAGTAPDEYVVSRHHAEIAEVLGINPAAVRRSLASLCNDRLFRAPDGTSYGVLTKLARGCRRQTTVYRNNVRMVSRSMAAGSCSQSPGEARGGRASSSPGPRAQSRVAYE